MNDRSTWEEDCGVVLESVRHKQAEVVELAQKQLVHTLEVDQVLDLLAMVLDPEEHQMFVVQDPEVHQKFVVLDPDGLQMATLLERMVCMAQLVCMLKHMAELGGL